MSGKEIFMNSKSKFAQGIHRFVGVFAEETTVILGKGHIQKPVHRLNFPMFPGNFHQLFGRNIPAGNVIAGFPAVVSTSLYDTFNRENRL